MMADYGIDGPHVWYTKATLLQAVSQTSGTGETRWKSPLSTPRLSRMLACHAAGGLFQHPVRLEFPKQNEAGGC